MRTLASGCQSREGTQPPGSLLSLRVDHQQAGSARAHAGLGPRGTARQSARLRSHHGSSEGLTEVSRLRDGTRRHGPVREEGPWKRSRLHGWGGAEEWPGCSGLLHTAPVSTSAHQLRPWGLVSEPRGSRVPSLLRLWPVSEETAVSVCHPRLPSQGPALLNGPPAALLRNELGRVGTGWSVPQGHAGAIRPKPGPPPPTQACGGLSRCPTSSFPSPQTSPSPLLLWVSPLQRPRPPPDKVLCSWPLSRHLFPCPLRGTRGWSGGSEGLRSRGQSRGSSWTGMFLVAFCAAFSQSLFPSCSKPRPRGDPEDLERRDREGNPHQLLLLCLPCTRLLHACVHTHRCTLTGAQSHARPQTRPHRDTCGPAHTHAHSQAHAHTLTLEHTHSHMLTCSHTFPGHELAC